MNNRYRFRFWLEEEKRFFYFGFETFLTYQKQIEKALADGLKIYQSTGLKDKNGELIYEDEILYENIKNTTFPTGKYWIVKWNNNTAQFFIELINKTGNSLTDTWHLARHNLDYEVIGYIRENAELLEVNDNANI